MQYTEEYDEGSREPEMDKRFEYRIEEDEQVEELPVDEFLRMCLRDRYSLIVLPGIKSLFKDGSIKEYVQRNFQELQRKARVTGILVMKNEHKTFYHYTTKENAKQILSAGIKASSEKDENLSFGGGVIYTYADVRKFNQDADGCVLAIEYGGVYLESIWEEDKPESQFGTCLLYTPLIKDVMTYTATSLQKASGKKKLLEALIEDTEWYATEVEKCKTKYFTTE